MVGKEELTVIIDDFLMKKLENNLKELESGFINQRQKVTESFTAALNSLCTTVKQQQANGIKPPISYLHIAFLRSGLLMETYEFMLAMYSSQYWLDPVETNSYWKFDYAFQHASHDISELQALLKGKYSITEYELQEIKFRYLQLYLPIAQRLIGEFAPDAVKKSDFMQLSLDDMGYSVIYGGHMEENTFLYTINPKYKADMSEVI